MPKRDPKREHRIEMEIVVDAYGEQERAMGWYYYLQSQIRFPFTATCIVKRSISPLKVDDEVKIIGMPGEDECEHEMFVKIRWEKKALAVPLSQLKPTAATDKQTQQAVEDWLYWVKMGYQF
ncbi:MAG: calcium-binding protein [Nitrospiraceae bacterium]